MYSTRRPYQSFVLTLEELTRLGESMRAAFVRAALRDYTDG